MKDDYPYATRGQLSSLPWIKKGSMKHARLEVFGKARAWFVRLRYSNGRKSMVSESYPTERGALRAARAMRRDLKRYPKGATGLTIKTPKLTIEDYT